MLRVYVVMYCDNVIHNFVLTNIVCLLFPMERCYVTGWLLACRALTAHSGHLYIAVTTSPTASLLWYHNPTCTEQHDEAI